MSTGVLMIIGGAVIGLIGLLMIIMTAKSNKVSNMQRNNAQMKSSVNMNQMQNMQQMNNMQNYGNMSQNNQMSFDNEEVDIFNPNFEENQRKKNISSVELKPKQSNIDLDDDLEDF